MNFGARFARKLFGFTHPSGFPSLREARPLIQNSKFKIQNSVAPERSVVPKRRPFPPIAENLLRTQAGARP
jgi:hypothetical protein